MWLSLVVENIQKQRQLKVLSVVLPSCCTTTLVWNHPIIGLEDLSYRLAGQTDSLGDIIEVAGWLSRQIIDQEFSWRLHTSLAVSKKCIIHTQTKKTEMNRKREEPAGRLPDDMKVNGVMTARQQQLPRKFWQCYNSSPWWWQKKKRNQAPL